MTIGYRIVRWLILLLGFCLVITACAQISATDQEPALVYIDVATDVGPASAEILVDGDRKGYVGPGCQLIFAVNAGVHTVTYKWDGNSIDRDVEALAGKTLVIQIGPGPKITLPKTADESDACAT